MSSSPAKPAHSPAATASPALLAAAVAGLLCVSGACSAGDSEKQEGAQITASRTEPDMTLEKFTLDCTARSGRVETHAHCGGVNSCRGISYDQDTFVLTEHTCRGLNTCAGYSCVLG